MRKSRRAFTLFEVMLALAIMTLVAGMIYGVTEAVIRATTELTTEQERRREVDGLHELLAREFHALDPQTVLGLDVRENQGHYLSEITIEKAPGVFSWGRESWYFGLIVLGLEVAPNGLLRFGIRRESSDLITKERGGDGAKWLPLVDNLKSLEWSFYDGQARLWDGKWANRAVLPLLVKLKYRFANDPMAGEMVFSLPWTTPMYGQTLNPPSQYAPTR
jgi:prepilin-type N-terminal cleavage/methylation domain-containing protein